MTNAEFYLKNGKNETLIKRLAYKMDCYFDKEIANEKELPTQLKSTWYDFINNFMWEDYQEDEIEKEWQENEKHYYEMKLEQLKEKEKELTDEQGYWGDSKIQEEIEELEAILNDK